MKNLVYVTAAVLVLSACGGMSQNPITKYPEAAKLKPSETVVEGQKMPVEFRERIVTRVDEKIVYVDREKAVPVPTYIPRSVGSIPFFDVTSPKVFKFVVGKPIRVPVRIRGGVGQMKYEVAVESATLKHMKLENIKIEGNDTIADLTFTAATSDIATGEVIGLGELTFKMTILEVKDSNAELDALYKEAAKNNSTIRDTYGYVVLPASTATTDTPVGVVTHGGAE